MDHCDDHTGDYHDRSSGSGLKHVAISTPGSRISTPGSRKPTPGKENQPRPTCVRQVFTEDTLGCGTVDFGKYSHIHSITRETNVCKGRIPNLRRWKNFEKNLQYSFQNLGLGRWCQPNFEELKKSSQNLFLFVPNSVYLFQSVPLCIMRSSSYLTFPFAIFASRCLIFLAVWQNTNRTSDSMDLLPPYPLFLDGYHHFHQYQHHRPDCHHYNLMIIIIITITIFAIIITPSHV